MHRPKKRFGQNFLRDPNIVRKIIAAAGLEPGDRVVEIGPGLGALTEHLLEAAGRVHVLEIDRDLARQWAERPEPNLVVHEGDALRLDWAVLFDHPPYKMVANLPYNISSQILFKVLEHRERFSRLILMFQKEVGDRLCASPGGKDYGILSVLFQLWFDIKKVTPVPPGAFFPPPKVHSSVLRFEPLEAPRVPVADHRFFARVVKGAFSQRRKTLRNALVGSGFGFEGLDEALQVAGIDPGRRGETLDLAEFARLAKVLMEANPGSRPEDQGDNGE
ncbi:ribosomal RNA small subunit methyltransferase A [Desulfuromonas versatilis]|uniref:Ribosomal RNA small subunit methyltransferase A n=1 Tax=Desulfuromonas versatilis TaxID=2802975 RepID=A0ABN6DZL6_9BACT|nr:16S rRNA (adenine(1518)-N(6)/adenine(1519)-N(6))-dimethyltransferase RsmA [Desulfuromonas versatilis]BCR05332.1 ribosomal RNA small subunit methyltransferase A [Desulfuromonas versatilis]